MEYKIISHTHWDREWYMPFEQFRFKLVDLIDRLMEIIERDCRYKFHLDAQTIVLEDYIQIRPERAERLKEYIKRGNIIVGPWYLQNDFYLTSGEATVRNLQIGIESAKRWGKCANVGYAPDQFGNVSQLPQIFAGFGIRDFMFGRGYSYYDERGERKAAPAEFKWKTEDGSECLAVHLNQWYNNAQHIPEEKEKAKLLLKINAKIFSKLNATPYVVLMNGVDHLEPQEDVLQIAEALQSEGIKIEQSDLDGYFGELHKWIEENGVELSEYRGALNQGKDDELLRGCWSARIYLKRENVRAQTAIEDKIEPLYAYLEKKGLAGIYPRGYTDYYWKELLKNHPHDSICCCSRDEIARHMEDNYARLAEVSEALTERGMKALTRHSEGVVEGEYVITVFNGTERAYSGTVEAEIRFLQTDEVKAFAVLDERGKEVEFEVTERSKGLYDVFSGMNLPGVLSVETYRISLNAEEIPAYGAVQYTVSERERFTEWEEEYGGIENEYYKLGVEKGRITLYNKETGRKTENFIKFEETGDSGNIYVYQPEGEAIYDETESIKTRIGRMSKSIEAETRIKVPARYDRERKKRSEEEVTIRIRYGVTLRKKSRTLEINYEIENEAEDQRIRIVVDGGIPEEVMTVDTAFDSLEVRGDELCALAASKTFCNATYAAKRGEDGGFALYTEGQHEAESVGGGIALTVLRSSGIITEGAGKQWETPEGQCKRKIAGRIGYGAFKRETNANLYAYAKQYRTGMVAYYDGKDPAKFAGGRFAVQDAKLAQYYSDRDPYEGKSVKGGALFGIDGEDIAVTAVRQSLDGQAIIVRLVNLTSRTAECGFTYEGEIFETRLDESTVTYLGAGSVRLLFRPKQIITLRI